MLTNTTNWLCTLLTALTNTSRCLFSTYFIFNQHLNSLKQLIYLLPHHQLHLPALTNTDSRILSCYPSVTSSAATGHNSTRFNCFTFTSNWDRERERVRKVCHKKESSGKKATAWPHFLRRRVAPWNLATRQTGCSLDEARGSYRVAGLRFTLDSQNRMWHPFKVGSTYA